MHPSLLESFKQTLDVRKEKLRVRPKSWTKFFHTYLPITDWLFNYDLRNDIVHDLIAGVTIAIMHIPQGSIKKSFYQLRKQRSSRLLFLGMAYAQLAETNQMVGMYTAVFPVALYTLLGPSRHVSMGEPDSFSGFFD